jgi:hypothetical protein
MTLNRATFCHSQIAMAHPSANVSSSIIHPILKPKHFIYLPVKGYKVKVFLMHAKKAHRSGSGAAILRFDNPVVLSK